jgi:glycosyltransferase involved in cell wall biosynthesis
VKIAILVTQMESGGAQKAALTLAQGLMERGHSVMLFVMYEKGDCIEHFSAGYGVPIRSLAMKPDGAGALKKVLCVVSGFFRMIAILRRERFDLLQTFTHYSNILGPVWARLTGISLCFVSQRNAMENKPRWVQRSERLIFNSSLVKHATAVSQQTREYAVKSQNICAEKISVIPNSVNVAQYSEAQQADEAVKQEILNLTGGSCWVLCVGRLHPQKGHSFLFQAFSEFVQQHDDARLLVVGEGHLLAELEELIATLNLGRHVFLLGSRSDIPSLLRVCQVFVLPSLYEGMPNVVLEAMAAKIPIIATAVDGTCELIEDGCDGALVPPGDSAALGRALEVITAGDVSSLVDHAYRRACSVYDVQRNIDAYETLYKKFLIQG